MFSQTTEYAMRAMASLAAQPHDLVATPTLARRTKVPSNYLAKVLQQLAQAKLITGRRGVGGGYKLARAATEITLLDVINAVGKVERITTCPLGLPDHGSNLCTLHRKTDEAAAAVIRIFDGVSLQDLLDDPRTASPLCDVEPTAKLTVSVPRRAVQPG